MLTHRRRRRFGHSHTGHAFGSAKGLLNCYGAGSLARVGSAIVEVFDHSFDITDGRWVIHVNAFELGVSVVKGCGILNIGGGPLGLCGVPERKKLCDIRRTYQIRFNQ